MSPRSFWIILLKLVGIWIMFSSITVVPQFIISLWPIFSSNQVFENWEVLLILLIAILIYLWIFRVLIVRPGSVIDKLKLDEGFDEDRLDFNIHRSTVVTIAIIIIGGLMIIDSVPLFFRQLFLYLQSRTTPYNSNLISPTWIFVYLVKTLIGYLLIANNRMVVNFIEKTRRLPAEHADAETPEIEPTEPEEN
jgi:hypothetical protein